MEVRRHSARRWEIFGVVIVLAATALPGGQAKPRNAGGRGSSWVQVTDVVDGDTIHVGWPERTTVRLKCVDTPETVHPKKPVEFYGPEASAFTKHSLTGRKVRLETDATDGVDRYGRTLAYIFLEDGMLFNIELVRLGYGRTTRFPCRYRDEVEAAESEARAAHRGLWSKELAGSTDARGPLVVGNRRSRVYHVPGQAQYAIAAADRAYFDSEDEAIRAGYRRAKR